MDSVFDSWGEYNRECTSAVAWWLHERNGFEMPFHDNASGWGPDARARGFAVNGTPAVGSVAWWGAGDHVAWVAAVSGGSVRIEEYNYGYQGHYHERTIPASAPSGYIHFKDLTTAPSWPPAEGSFVSHGGFIYRIVGGAPVYVFSWGAVGGPQPSTPLSAAQFASLPQFPRNGTILDSSGGGVYIAAGGAPLYLSNWAAIGGPKAGIGIDQAAINNAGGGVPWDHLRAYPADGTFLNSSTGAVYRVAGGAPMFVSNWNIYGGVQPYVTIDQWDLDHAGSTAAAHLRAYPADGTFLNSSTGAVYRVAGGAPMFVSNWNIYGGVQPYVTIDQWDLDHAGNSPAAHLRAYPADGTLVATSGDGRVYEIAGGAPLYVSNWNAIGGARPSTGIDQWDVNHPENPAAHLREYPQDGTFILTSTGRVYRVAGGAPFYVSSWSVFDGIQPHVGADQWAVDNASDPHAHVRPSPLDGTVVQGIPSMQYWSFTLGLRSPTTANPRATQVDDVGLAAFPEATTRGPVTAASARPRGAKTGTCRRRHYHKHRRHRHHRKGRRRHRRARSTCVRHPRHRHRRRHAHKHHQGRASKPRGQKRRHGGRS